MSETTCPCCGVGSPESARYCMGCGEPILCKNCGAGILANARACIQCGKLIPERESGDLRFAGGAVVPPGYNRLTVHQRDEMYSYDADFVFSDTIGQQSGTGEFIGRFAAFGDKVASSRPVPQRAAQASDFVEVVGQQASVPQLAPAPEAAPASPNGATSPHIDSTTPEERAIHTVFSEHDGTLTLQVRDLKATSQTDHTLRLAHMFLYARKVLHGELSTPRSAVYEVTDFASLPRDNVKAYLSRDTCLIKTENGEVLGLNLDGLEHARKCLLDILDPNVPGGKWPPSSEARAGAKPRRAAKRGGDNSADDEIVAIASHAATHALVRDIPHNAIADMPVLDKSIVALYGMNKAGHQGEAYYTIIEEYLYRVFHVRVNVESIRSALRKAVDDKNIHVVFREGAGYRITPTGIEYVEHTYRARDDASGAEQPQLELGES